MISEENAPRYGSRGLVEKIVSFSPPLVRKVSFKYITRHGKKRNFSFIEEFSEARIVPEKKTKATAYNGIFYIYNARIFKEYVIEGVPKTYVERLRLILDNEIYTPEEFYFKRSRKRKIKGNIPDEGSHDNIHGIELFLQD